MDDQILVQTRDDLQPYYQIITFNHLPEIYHNLVLSRWLRSYKTGNSMFKLIDNNCYFKHYQIYLKKLIRESQVSLAQLTDNDAVLGLSVFQDPCLHYIHVSRDFRRQGIGRSLMPKSFQSFSHITDFALQLWPKYPGVIFNPF
jgi:ribosomal protein S18 acetylase RimI-like enzyme